MYVGPLFRFSLLFFFCLWSGSVNGQQPSDVSSGLAEVNGTKLYYEVAGSGHALVLIHGGQLDSRMWDEQFRLFSQRYRTIRYDVRGYGRSIPATSPYASEDDLYALLKFLKVQKAYLVGLSLGGRIVIDFALAHPEMVDALVPVAPGLSGFQFTPDPNDIAILQAAQAGDLTKTADLWLSSGYMKPAMENRSISPRIRQLAQENARQNIENPLLERIPERPAIQRLAEIKAPTLIIVGNLDVNDIHAITGLLRARIPHAEEVVIEGAGHMVSMEKPAEFNRALLDFLDHLPSK